MPPRGYYAIVLDGAFVVKKRERRLGTFPTASDLRAECTRVRNHTALKGNKPMRISCYEAPPATGRLQTPLDGSIVVLENTTVAIRNANLLSSLTGKGRAMGQNRRFGMEAGQAIYAKSCVNPTTSPGKRLGP